MMFKKAIMIVTLLVALPGFAHAWSVTSKAMTTGGTITPAGIRTYASTTAYADYTVTANSGYAIDRVTGATAQGGGVYRVTKGIASIYSVQAFFVANPTLVAVSATQPANGSISLSYSKYGSWYPIPAGGVPTGSTVKVKVFPQTNDYKVATILNGVTDITPAGPFTGGIPVETTLTASAAVSITATLAPIPVARSVALTLVAPYNVTTVTVGGTIQLTATGLAFGQVGYQWNVTPATGYALNGVFANSTTVTKNFVPSARGTWQVFVTLSSANNKVSSQTVTLRAETQQDVDNRVCTSCHLGRDPELSTFQIWSSQYVNPNTSGIATCAYCHGVEPHGSTCNNCHTEATHAFASTVTPDAAKTGAGPFSTCSDCHSNAVTVHGAPTGTCIGCHAAAVSHPGNVVRDNNNGVRAITGEFSKWSHHVTGVTVNDAHCAACHLEGKVSGTAIVIDPVYHMANAKTHLRDTSAGTDADFAWDPASPNHTGMDTFCMSCHDSDGASSAGSAAIQALINANGLAAPGKTASATNPFGDTISNQYDLLERPAVVDARGQFGVNNPSHHAVLAPRYTGRDRASVNAAAFVANSSATLPGKRQTIFEAGKFNAQYTPLGATLAVADDSQLHCGDCHTVGQFKPNATTNVNGALVTTVIGAHGSNNEYMLRNTTGTDMKHTGVKFTGNGNFGTTAVDANGNPTGTTPYLVCFNCHAFKTYGTTAGVNGWAGKNHAGDYATSDRCNGPYNTINTAFGNMTGERRISSVKTNNTNGTLAGSTFGNMFGIQCANCHNSGISADNIFGGIHGSKTQTYTDGMGNTTKHYRFMPGLGNSMFVPGTKGGFSGGTLATYAMYSGNREGGTTTGQTFTQLPVRSIVPAGNRVNGGTTALALTRGSYEYVTGGTSLDANWEQQTQQTVAGEFDFRAKAMGCYTITPPGTLKSVTATGGASSDNVVTNMNRLSATDLQDAGLTGPNGTAEMFDNWGGCDDHNGPQGAGTGIVRKVLRPVNY